MTTYICKPCNYAMGTEELVDGKCDECGGPVEAIPLLTSDRIANKSKDPSYSPHGYTVMEDGTIYTLTKQWTHGTLLAILFPDMAKKAGYEPPDEDFNVFKYQRFELDNHDNFPVIRVAFGMISDFAISKGRAPATKEQIAAMVKIFKEMGRKMHETVQTDIGEMSAKDFLDQLRKGGPSYDLPSPTTKLVTPKKREIPRRREDD